MCYDYRRRCVACSLSLLLFEVQQYCCMISYTYEYSSTLYVRSTHLLCDHKFVPVQVVLLFSFIYFTQTLIHTHTYIWYCCIRQCSYLHVHIIYEVLRTKYEELRSSYFVNCFALVCCRARSSLGYHIICMTISCLRITRNALGSRFRYHI